MLRSMVPWRERFPATFPQFENEMENLMERFFGNGGEEWGLTRFTPSLNISETDSNYEVTVDLPGLKPEDVQVDLSNGNLRISGERKEEHEEKGKTFHRIERRHGEFRRTVQLPDVVDDTEVDARFAEGVLTIRVPKSAKVRPRRIPIKV